MNQFFYRTELNKSLRCFVCTFESAGGTMKYIFGIFAAAGLVLSSVTAAAEKPLVYYVQLIRCSDVEQAPEPGSRRIGARLAERFQCVFRCKSYWEISRDKVEVLPSQTARARLRNGREVEIDLSFSKGRLIDRTVEPASENMTLIGGDRDQTSHWFIVVRRDKPSQ
jgi:hypothetical protein